jgi:hypothetical protein
MAEKPESEDFEEDDPPESPGESEELDFDHLMRDLETQRRRGVKAGEPAWRRLERYIEDKHTAELLSDFDDYIIGDEDARDGKSEGRPRKHRKLRRH